MVTKTVVKMLRLTRHNCAQDETSAKSNGLSSNCKIFLAEIFTFTEGVIEKLKPSAACSSVMWV